MGWARWGGGLMVEWMKVIGPVGGGRVHPARAGCSSCSAAGGKLPRAERAGFGFFHSVMEPAQSAVCNCWHSLPIDSSAVLSFA